MRPEFVDLIKTAGIALENEDRYLIGAIVSNMQAYKNCSGGILRINNERYYQFIIARALTSSFPFQVQIEKNTHDFMLIDSNNNDKAFCVIEMKRYMSPEGNVEIPRIKNDINKILNNTTAPHGMELIVSANPIGNSLKEANYLVGQLGNYSVGQNDIYIFNTIDTKGDRVEFWVAGIEIK